MQKSFSLTLFGLLALSALVVARFKITPRKDSPASTSHEDKGSSWKPIVPTVTTVLSRNKEHHHHWTARKQEKSTTNVSSDDDSAAVDNNNNNNGASVVSRGPAISDPTGGGASALPDDGIRSQAVFFNEYNPGRCTITPVVILHPGETARDPEGGCGRLRCMDRRGNVEVTRCRQVANPQPPAGCVLDDTLPERVLYPGCCEQRFNCTTPQQ